MTDQQYNDWLKSQSAVRCILIEADVKTGGAVVTRYLSNRGYTTSPTDTPANTSYSPRVVGGIKFTRSLSTDGSVSLGWGDIELNNTDGSLDSWIDDYWANRNIKFYLGDMSWPRSDFRQVFAGTITGIDTRKRDRINIKLSDKLQRLNYPMTESKLGGSTSLADNLKPLLFGECHNIEPLLIDASVNEYMVHDGAIERIIEVRDNGVPVSITTTLGTGKFRLVNAPAGTITVSAQGAQLPTSLLTGGTNVYKNTIAELISYIVTTYGGVTKFSSADLDVSSLTAFNTANLQPVGLYLKDRTNVLEACNQLASSIGARMVIGNTGLMSLVKLTLPQATAGTSITSSDFVDRSIEIASLADVVASVKIGYDKNYTVQSDLTTGILQEHAALFAEEWLTFTQTDSSTASNYNLYTDPDMEETNLLTVSDASAEASRRLTLWSTQRKIIKYQGFYHLIFETLGGSQTITHSRFGLSGGKRGQIISISIDWLSPYIDFQVLV